MICAYFGPSTLGLSYLLNGKGGESKEVGLLHDPNELLLVDLAISVAICLVDHLLQLLVRHGLSEFPRHSLQIFKRDLAGAVVIEQPEGLENFFPRVAFGDLAGHQLHKICELDNSLSLAIHLGNHLLDLLFLGLEAQRTHGDLKLLGVDVSCIGRGVPTPSVSNRSKAYLISCFCSSVSSFRAFLVGLRGAFSFLKVDMISNINCIWFEFGWVNRELHLKAINQTLFLYYSSSSLSSTRSSSSSLFRLNMLFACCPFRQQSTRGSEMSASSMRASSGFRQRCGSGTLQRSMTLQSGFEWPIQIQTRHPEVYDQRRSYFVCLAVEVLDPVIVKNAIRQP